MAHQQYDIQQLFRVKQNQRTMVATNGFRSRTEDKVWEKILGTSPEEEKKRRQSGKPVPKPEREQVEDFYAHYVKLAHSSSVQFRTALSYTYRQIKGGEDEQEKDEQEVKEAPKKGKKEESKKEESKKKSKVKEKRVRPTRRLLYVHFADAPAEKKGKIPVDEIVRFGSGVTESGATEAVFIFAAPLGSTANNKLNDIQSVAIRKVPEAELRFDITRRVEYDDVRVMSKAEEEALTKREDNPLKLGHFSRQGVRDPVSRYHDFHEGDLLEISRHYDRPYAIIPAYRLVVP